MIRKHSKQRELIYSFLATRKDHPTADMVYANVRKSSPNISLGTVYRNLALLADSGQIQRLRLGDGIDRFDANLSPHYHFVCSSCGAVIDLDMEGIGEILKAAEKNFDGTVEGHVTYFYGRCGACKHSL